MATSLAAQLQSIKSFIQVDTEPAKRPFTRPSILYDAKQAADIDLDTIFTIAQSGLDDLVAVNEKFQIYKSSLFSGKSKDLDREALTAAENRRLDKTISAYLKLLSGYLHLQAALRTIEYLLRRYKIHIYNFEQLILCALPYHDTHSFVRIVQLINFGNSKWKFLDAVKTSGAPPPRSVFVQQCRRDIGVMEAVCAYSSPVKKYQPSKPVITFCTALVIEFLGSVDGFKSENLRKIIPFVTSGLQPGSKGGHDHKAGSLMIIGFMSSKVSMNLKLINSVVRAIAVLAQEYSKDSSNLQWCRMYLMALINIIQLQSKTWLPRKIVQSLAAIRDFDGIILGLMEDFNINRFLAVYLEMLVAYSSDDVCHQALLSFIKRVPAKVFVDLLVSKVLSSCVRFLDSAKNPTAASSDSVLGVRAREILVEFNKRYSLELRTAVRKFMEDTSIQTKKHGNLLEVICKMLDGNDASSVAVSDSKLWLMIDHPKAEVRRTALSGLTKSAILEAHQSDSQSLVRIQEAVLLQLHDDDLTVIKAALSIDGLPDIMRTSDLFEALHSVLCRCVTLVMGACSSTNVAVDTALLCLEHASSKLLNDVNFSSRLASMIFPLLLILSRTRKLNQKALHMAKSLNWSLYQNLDVTLSEESLHRNGDFASINMETINCLTKAFLDHIKDVLPWIINSCDSFEISRTTFLLIIMHSLSTQLELGQFLTLFENCMPFLKKEWGVFESTMTFKELKAELNCTQLLDQLSDTDLRELNGSIMYCIFWRLAEAFGETTPLGTELENDVEWSNKFRELFVFLSTSKLKDLLREKLCYLVSRCKTTPLRILTSFFTDEGVSKSVQVESLHCLEYLCTLPVAAESSVQLLGEFPSILVPLSDDDQDIRLAALECVEGLSYLSDQIDFSGTNANWKNFLNEVLTTIIQQKGLILADRNFLSSLLTSIMGTQTENFSVLHNVGPRFNQATKNDMLSFIVGCALRLSTHAKFKILYLLDAMGSDVMCVEGVDSLLSDLVKRRAEHHLKLNGSFQKLSEIEINMLCHLVKHCAVPASGGGHFETLLEVLQIGTVSSDDPAIVRPSITVLANIGAPLYESLSFEMQERLFLNLIVVFRSGNNITQSAARQAILRLNIKCSSVTSMLNRIIDLEIDVPPKKMSKRYKKFIVRNSIGTGDKALTFISSLFDIILLKKDMEKRESILGPLFQLLCRIFSKDWVLSVANSDAKSISDSSGVLQSTSSSVVYIQQTLLLIIEEIISALNSHIKDDVLNMIDVKSLVEIAHSVTDAVTRNHVFSVLSSITRVSPDNVLHHMVMIVKAIGESTVTQVDNYSERVFAGIISTIFPCWLSKGNDCEQLLKIFVDILPEVAEHRRLPIIINILRTLGECHYLASLLILLFRSLIVRKGTQSADALVSEALVEWEYNFAIQVYDQYSCSVWLPSLALLLKKLGNCDADQNVVMELVLAVKFCFKKLQDPEITFKLKRREDTDDVQKTLGEVMEQVVALSLFCGSIKAKTGPLSILGKVLKEDMRALLKIIVGAMIPSAYFNTILKLLGHGDGNVRKKALLVLCETMKDQNTVKVNRRRDIKTEIVSPWLYADESSRQSFDLLCSQIIQLVDGDIDSPSLSLKLSAVSAIEVLATSSPLNQSVFGNCLASVSKSIDSLDMHMASCCLQAAGALINQLGPRALPELPVIMNNIWKRFRNLPSESKVTEYSALSGALVLSESFVVAVLDVLAVAIDKLGSFLSPYLVDIVELLVLYPDCVSKTHLKLKLKADAVRKLFAERINVRLALPPLMKVYTVAVKSGDSSVTVLFEMLTSLICLADRQSIKAHHTKFFDVCLLGLDLRRQHPESVHHLSDVETVVIDTLVSLTKKLTETMFKPLFLRSIEWAELDVEQSVNNESANIEKAVSFYGLVSRLSKDLGSPFVPYFKYLLESCVRYLSGADNTSIKRKKKKAKVQDALDGSKDVTVSLAIQKWHLRALILSSLYNCFLHDSDNSKFLDKANFDTLLEPIVSQLDVDPPISLEDHPEVPSVEQVDSLLVTCIGQMAVCVGTDTLWKELNNRVLMQTRSDKVRAKILGLRVVKNLSDNLKEEYLVLLAETIPFLSELLEDVELPVKNLAKEVCKELEFLSKEDLSEYLK